MSLLTFLFVPTIIFLSVVAPIWIIMHYRAKHKERASISEDEQQSLDALLETLDKLSSRVETLEEILDADQPGWKSSAKEDK